MTKLDALALFKATSEVTEAWNRCIDELGGFNSTKTKFAMVALMGGLALRFQALVIYTDKIAHLLANETAKDLNPPPPTPEDAEEFELVVNLAKDLAECLEKVRQNPQDLSAIDMGFSLRTKQVLDTKIQDQVDEVQDQLMNGRNRPGTDPSMN